MNDKGRKSIMNSTAVKDNHLRNTCVSMNCPFIPICNKYNFLVERGEKCSVQEDILYKAKELEKQRKKRNNMIK
jgi:hypothetical protein